MPPRKSLRKLRVIQMVMALGAVALGQDAPKPDPLAGLFRQPALEDRHVGLHVTVVDVPAGAAVDAILADDGSDPAHWHKTLIAWRDAKLLEFVDGKSVTGLPGTNLEQKGSPFRYITQDDASHFWDDFRMWEAWSVDRPDANTLLQELQEEEV